MKERKRERERERNENENEREREQEFLRPLLQLEQLALSLSRSLLLSLSFLLPLARYRSLARSQFEQIPPPLRVERGIK
jgi:hypothetical protein